MMIFIWFIFVILWLGMGMYSIYHKTSHLANDSYLVYYIIIFLLLCELVYIFKYRKIPFLLDEGDTSIISKFLNVIANVILPIAVGYLFTDSFNVLYTKIFGYYEKPFQVDILEIEHKPYVSRRNSGHTYVYILSQDQKREILNVSTSFYKKITEDDQLIINRKVSFFGNYIDEDEIIIIKNKH